MMNWILLVMAAVAAVVVAMIVGGLLSPRVRVAVASWQCEGASSDDVFRLVREADGPPRWCPDLPTMVVEAEQPPEQLRLALRDDDGAPLGSWDVQVAAADGGAEVTITETVAVPNPIRRFLLAFGGHGERPRRFLAAAAAELRRRPPRDIS